jgi:hypothetical protein
MIVAIILIFTKIDIIRKESNSIDSIALPPIHQIGLQTDSSWIRGREIAPKGQKRCRQYT